MFCLSSLLLSISSLYFISGVILPFLNSGTETAIMGPLASILGVYSYISIARLFIFGGGYAKHVDEEYIRSPTSMRPLPHQWHSVKEFNTACSLLFPDSEAS